MINGGKVGCVLCCSSDLEAGLEERPTRVQQTVAVRATAASSCCVHITKKKEERNRFKIWNQIIRKQISYAQNTLFSSLAVEYSV